MLYLFCHWFKTASVSSLVLIPNSSATYICKYINSNALNIYYYLLFTTIKYLLCLKYLILRLNLFCFGAKNKIYSFLLLNAIHTYQGALVFPFSHQVIVVLTVYVLRMVCCGFLMVSQLYFFFGSTED